MMTAVEFLIEKTFSDYGKSILRQEIKMALEMEKQQIIDAYEASEMNENETRYKIVAGERFYSYEHAEDYYKETYDKTNG
jgi:hypothetical protein